MKRQLPSIGFQEQQYLEQLGNVQEWYSMAMALKQSEPLLAYKLLKKSLVLDNGEGMALAMNISELETQMLGSLKALKEPQARNEDIIYVFVPHFLGAAISSHKYLYVSWLNRIFKAFPEKNIHFFVTHEGGNSNPAFTREFLKEHLHFSHFVRLTVSDFPRYLTNRDEYRFFFALNNNVAPYFSLIFETNETQKKSYMTELLCDISPVLSVHCNPQLSISSEVHASFVGHESRAGGRAYFLPALVRQPKEDKESIHFEKLSSENYVIVTAFTNNRIYKAFKNAPKLLAAFLSFLEANPDVEWHFIGHESANDFCELDPRISKLIGLQVKVLPVTNKLSAYYQHCDIYTYLPGFYGGDSGSRMAIETGLPCVAMIDRKGGYIKYATSKYVQNSVESYFDFIDSLIRCEGFRSEVVACQQDYIDSMEGDDVLKRFQYITEKAISVWGDGCGSLVSSD